MNGKAVLMIAMMVVISGILVLYAYQLSIQPADAQQMMSPTLMVSVVLIFAFFLTLIFYAPKIKRGLMK